MRIVIKDYRINGGEKMRIETRADGLHISGYVNVTGKPSRPVITPHGKVIETIEERAFDNAIKKSGDITVTVDHDSGHVYASTKDGTLQLSEDAIGLHADVLITDPTVIEMAKKGKIRGWSFGMYNVIDELEQRAEGLPIRHVKDFMLDHITLVKDKIPCYSATSVEYRAENAVDIEERSMDIPTEYIEKPDYTNFKERMRKIL
ncbi:MAG: HK97 family phage prohead protease [Ruminococcus sp.]|nr:HK97 family phage prohead protease [Ruminococcus sp.]